MRELPILMNGPMVRAVLEGRKTVTRRLVTPAPYMQEIAGSFGCQLLCFPDRKLKGRGLIWPNAKESILEQCPYGQPGDRLWAREAWRSLDYLDDLSGSAMAEKCLDAGYRHPWAPIRYEADASLRDWMHVGTPPHQSGPVPGRYRHARFMPRWASRITLEVTGLRVERLQGITDAQCIAEGCAGGHGSIQGYNYNASPLEHFRHVWANTGGDWGANPWVWVISFKRIEQERKAA